MADAAGPPPRGKNLVKVAEVAYAMKKRALEERDEAHANAEKQQKTLTDIAKEFICPITHELPIKPVTAEDGKIYEEKAIREWFSKKDGEPTSPSTGAIIGKKLFPAPQARNTIEALVKSGAIDGEIAEAWQKKLEQETLVKGTRAKAEGGDGNAMYNLGLAYEVGSYGLAEDAVQARSWFERSAAARYPQGLAVYGKSLLRGVGGPQDNVFGIMNVTQAAGLGSDVAAFILGFAFFEGVHGLPKDTVRARYWLKKAIGEREIHLLHHRNIAEATEWLRELEQEA